MRVQEGGRERAELRTVVRTVRNRWRLRHALRGLLLSSGALLAAVGIGALAVDRWPLGAASLTIFVVALFAGAAVVVVRALVRPLVRRVGDREVALYLEEREPELRAEILTAVETLDSGVEGADEGGLLDGLVHAAVVRARGVEGGRRVDRDPLRKLSWGTGAAAVALLLLLLADPLGLRESLPRVVQPWTAVEAAPTLAVRVMPGDTVVARGSELRLGAELLGFEAERVEVAVRTVGGERWERWPMIRGEGRDDHEFVLFRIEEPIEYFAEAEGVRSGTHRVAVVDLPYVSRLELELHHPAYTRLPPEHVENGGDLAVLPGTRVEVRAHPTIAVPAGRIVLEGADDVTLEPADGSALAGQFRVDRAGYYRIDLEDGSGRVHRASPDHVIDLIEDLPPVVSIAEPGRDLRSTSVEEVYVEVHAADDHAVAALELEVAVNGGEPRTIPLLRDGGAHTREVSVGHTFFLEELDLEPGDLVAYHARARDAAPDAEVREARTDLFFIQIRPFSQEFRQADQGAGGMQGDGQGGEEMSGQLSRRQREIVTATFNVERDRRGYASGELEENVATIALAQERLEQEVATLVRRLAERGIGAADPEMQRVAEELPRAAEAMRDALEELHAVRAADALAPEQRALQHLLRAEAAFREVQLRWEEQQQGGGGGDPGEDLADFFDLELDRMRNQYEALQQGERQEMDRRMDETMERLRELARRQQQEAERLRRAAEQRPPGAPGAGGDSQRRLAEETEEMARQLERLARERSSPELERTARQLQEAAEAMRRSAASRDERGVGQAAEAAGALEEARRRLERTRADRVDRDAGEAVERAERALDRQRRIEEAVGRLPDGPERRAASGPIMEQKDELVREVEGLQEELRRLGRETAEADRDAARGFREAADAIREGRIADRIEFSRNLVGSARPDQNADFEADLTERLEAVRDRVAEARGALDGRERDRAGELADRTRNLLRGAESMAERAREAGERGEEGRADGGGGTPDAETVRQLQREAGERGREAEALRAELDRAGVSADGIDQVVRGFGALQRSDPYGDPRGLADLHRDLVERLREIDFALRRHFAAGDREGPRVEGSGEIPESYRALVEEYFRSLARPDR